jgi:hypothetical protein
MLPVMIEYLKQAWNARISTHYGLTEMAWLWRLTALYVAPTISMNSTSSVRWSTRQQAGFCLPVQPGNLFLPHYGEKQCLLSGIEPVIWQFSERLRKGAGPHS